MAGIRDSKTVDGVKYNYLTLDGKVVRQTWGSNVLDIIYDNSGLPYALKYNGAYYIYVLNQQGDVIRIVNSTGATVAEYRYDAWGNVIYSNGSMAAVNPIRYRGYYYDIETGFYYLQSRYYDPSIGRFINADDVMFSGADGSFLSHNLFAYCHNNPVNLSDSGGNLPTWAKKLAVAAAVVVTVAAVAAVTVATGGATTALACAAVGAAKGAAIGFVTGAVSGAATGAVTHIATTGSTVGIGDAMLNGMADGALTGAISGAVTGALTAPNCFIAGTAVLAAAGAVAIETIQAGDMVWAWDEETGEVALKEVVETYVNETHELVHVFANDEEIVTTPGHPFYSPVKGWTKAVELRAGDILVLVNGEYVIVEKIQHETLEAPVTVYNFQVEDYHTYYVTNAGVLVHNMCAANSGLNNKRLVNNEKIGSYKNVSLDLERGATGPNIHVHLGKGSHSKYIYDGVYDFINDLGNPLNSTVRESQIIQKGLAHALKLLENGW